MAGPLKPIDPMDEELESNFASEWGKGTVRSFLDTARMINNSAGGISDSVGRLVFNTRPENNPVSQKLRERDEEYQAMTLGYTPSQEKDVMEGRVAPINTPLTRNKKWAEEHPVQTFLMEQGEGAAPFVGSAALLAMTKRGGTKPLLGKTVAQYGLPAMAGLSTMNRLTSKNMYRGMDSLEAHNRSLLPAATETAMFAMMHKAKAKVMGSGPAGNFVPGSGKFAPINLLKKAKLKDKPGAAFLRDKFSKAPRGITDNVLREAAFVGPYLYAQGKAVQGAEVISGATTPEDFMSHAGYDPNASAVDNVKGVLTQQAKELTTSMFVGGAFGLGTGIKNKPREATENLARMRMLEVQRAIEQQNKEAKIELQKEADAKVKSGVAAKTLLGEETATPEEMRQQEEVRDQHGKMDEVADQAAEAMAQAEDAISLQKEMDRLESELASLEKDTSGEKLYTPLEEQEYVMPMSRVQRGQVQKGTKTTQSRNIPIGKGRHKLPDGTFVRTEGDARLVDPNELTLAQHEEWARAEGFKDLADAKKNAQDPDVRAFARGKKSIYVADIKLEDGTRLHTELEEEGPVVVHDADAYFGELLKDEGGRGEDMIFDDMAEFTQMIADSRKRNDLSGRNKWDEKRQREQYEYFLKTGRISKDTTFKTWTTDTGIKGLTAEQTGMDSTRKRKRRYYEQEFDETGAPLPRREITNKKDYAAQVLQEEISADYVRRKEEHLDVESQADAAEKKIFDEDYKGYVDNQTKELGAETKWEKELDDRLIENKTVFGKEADTFMKEDKSIEKNKYEYIKNLSQVIAEAEAKAADMHIDSEGIPKLTLAEFNEVKRKFKVKNHKAIQRALDQMRNSPHIGKDIVEPGVFDPKTKKPLVHEEPYVKQFEADLNKLKNRFDMDSIIEFIKYEEGRMLGLGKLKSLSQLEAAPLALEELLSDISYREQVEAEFLPEPLSVAKEIAMTSVLLDLETKFPNSEVKNKRIVEVLTERPAQLVDFLIRELNNLKIGENDTSAKVFKALTNHELKLITENFSAEFSRPDSRFKTAKQFIDVKEDVVLHLLETMYPDVRAPDYTAKIRSQQALLNLAKEATKVKNEAQAELFSSRERTKELSDKHKEKTNLYVKDFQVDHETGEVRHEGPGEMVKPKEADLFFEIARRTRRAGDKAKALKRAFDDRAHEFFVKRITKKEPMLETQTIVNFHKTLVARSQRGTRQGAQTFEEHIDGIAAYLGEFRDTRTKEWAGGKAFRDLYAKDKAKARLVVIDLFQQTFLNEGTFQTRAHRAGSVEKKVEHVFSKAAKTEYKGEGPNKGKKFGEIVVEGVESEYSIVEFNIERNREATQLGEKQETQLADAMTEEQVAVQKLYNVEEGVYLWEVTYPPKKEGGKPTVSVITDKAFQRALSAPKGPKFIDYKSFGEENGVRKTFTTIEKWNQANDVQNVREMIRGDIAQRAAEMLKLKPLKRTSANKTIKTINPADRFLLQIAQFQNLRKKQSMLKKSGMLLSPAEVTIMNKGENALTLGRALLAQERFRRENAVSSKYFEKWSAKTKELGAELSPGELFGLMRDVSFDKTRFAQAVREHVQDVYQKESDKAFAKVIVRKEYREQEKMKKLIKLFDQRERELRGSVEYGEIQSKIDAYIAKRNKGLKGQELINEKYLQEEIETLYETDASRDLATHDLGPAEKTEYEAYIYGKGKDLSSEKKALYEKLFEAERRIRYGKAESPATIINETGVIPSTTYVLHEKGVDKRSDFENKILEDHAADVIAGGVEKPKLRVGRLKSPVAQAFYGTVAKAFGADLVVVGGDSGYISRYIPKAADGKAKIVVNVDAKKSFSGIYAHEMFHHIVAKSNPVEYNLFRKNVIQTMGDYHSRENLFQKHVDRLVRRRGITEAVAQEEVLAEMFSHVVGQKEFYLRLAENKMGAGLAGRMINHLVKRVGEIDGLIRNPKQEGSLEWRFEKDILIKQEDMQGIYDLISDLVAGKKFRVADRKLADVALDKAEVKPAEGFDPNREPVHGEERFNTPLGPMTREEIKGWLDRPMMWAKGAWSKVFKPGTKNYKDLMNNLHEILSGKYQIIKKLKPNWIYGDYGVDRAITEIMSVVQNRPGRMQDEANYRLLKHKPVFKELNKDQKYEIYDILVRGIAEKKVFNEVLQEDTITSVKIGRLKLDTAKGRQEAKKLLEEFILAEQADAVIDAFIDFRKEAVAVFKELKKYYPELEFEDYADYGQTLRWMNKNQFVDTGLDWTINPEFSKLEGNKAYMKDKDTKIKTKRIAEKYDIEPRIIDPYDMMMDHILETNKLLIFHKAMKDATGKKTARKEGLVEIFSGDKKGEEEAIAKGFVPVPDNATKMHAKASPTKGFKIVKDGQEGTLIYNSEREAREALEAKQAKSDSFAEAEVISIVRDPVIATKSWDVVAKKRVEQPDGSFIEEEIGRRSYLNEQSAKDAMAEGKAKYEKNIYSIERMKGEIEGEVVTSRMYFHPDMATMMNAIIGKDHIRNGAVLGRFGNAAMKLKNMQTTVEFAWSMFHMMTIQQELASSYAAHGFQNRKNKKFVYNPLKMLIKANRESRQIADLAIAVMKTPDLAKNKAVVKKFKELLGVEEVDIIQMINDWKDAGGLMHQDSSLNSHLREYGEVEYSSKPAEMKIENGEVVFEYAEETFSGKVKDMVKSMARSTKEAHKQLTIDNPNSPMRNYAKSTAFIALEGTSAWLMQNMIPRIKMAQFMREYSFELGKQKVELATGLTTRHSIARDTRKFVEDRFGEVNWNNQWMDPTVKSGLQFFFRSFTWFTGSINALAKAGIDIGKIGWFAAKGERYQLTTKGIWGVTALLAHTLTAGLVAAMYNIGMVLEGKEEVETDEETPWLTRILFPRIDAYDPTRRVAVPSYITELVKIMRHIGVIGNEAEYSKLITGRTNSLISNLVEAAQGRDWRGVEIRGHDDNIAHQAFDTLAHIITVSPISVSTAMKNINSKGFDLTSAALAFMGMTDAPAAMKRSNATNKAFEIRREEHPTKTISSEKMEVSDEMRRAMYAYQGGNKEPLRQMRKDGKISSRKFNMALTRIPRIGGRKNPMYIDQLSQAMRGLTIEGAIVVWDYMSENEKKKHRPELRKKYYNMRSRQDRSKNDKDKIKEKMREAGLIK